MLPRVAHEYLGKKYTLCKKKSQKIVMGHLKKALMGIFIYFWNALDKKKVQTEGLQIEIFQLSKLT